MHPITAPQTHRDPKIQLFAQSRNSNVVKLHAEEVCVVKVPEDRE